MKGPFILLESVLKNAKEIQLTYCEVSTFYHPQIPDQLLYAEKAILTRLPSKNHKVCCREEPKLYFSHFSEVKHSKQELYFEEIIFRNCANESKNVIFLEENLV